MLVHTKQINYYKNLFYYYYYFFLMKDILWYLQVKYEYNSLSQEMLQISRHMISRCRTLDASVHLNLISITCNFVFRRE